MDGGEAREVAVGGESGAINQRNFGGSYSLLRDQPANKNAARMAGQRMQAQRLVWVAMSLMCSPPMRSSATRQARGPKARRASKTAARARERVRRRPAC